MSWLSEASSADGYAVSGPPRFVVAPEAQTYNKVRFSWRYNGTWHSWIVYIERSAEPRREGEFVYFQRQERHTGSWEQVWSSTEFDLTDRDSVILYHFNHNLPTGASGHGRAYPQGIPCGWEVLDQLRKRDVLAVGTGQMM